MTVRELRAVATLLRTVAEAEVARLEGDADRVAQLLDRVDPVEARGLARRADFDAGAKAIAGRIAAGTRKAW